MANPVQPGPPVASSVGESEAATGRWLGYSGKQCPTCSKSINLQSAYVQISGSAIRVFCSEECKLQHGRPITQVAMAPTRRRWRWWLLLVLIAGGTGVWAADRVRDHQPAPGPAPDLIAAAGHESEPPDAWQVTAPHPPPVGVSPNEVYWTGAIAADNWIHPLAGPIRRMPLRESRVFGAERPGHRPGECYRGHCGVDIGGEVWGEPVLAVHDGVVDRVKRNPNPNRGGKYVRLAHRDGTVFTQYFHLAAIPKWVRAGVEVRAGQVIGLVGETGVEHSGPHLHFTVSVKPGEGELEQFIDPEPLIALWPVSIPIYANTASIASTHVVPGRPRRGAGRFAKKSRSQGRADHDHRGDRERKQRKRRKKRRKRRGAPPPDTEVAAQPDGAEALEAASAPAPEPAAADPSPAASPAPN